MEESRVITEEPVNNIQEAGGIIEGSILKTLIRLSLPMLGGMTVQLLYTIVDTIWISRIDMNDPSYVGGVGLISPVLFIALAICSGLMTGVGSLVARSIGKKDLRTFNYIAESGLVLSLICAAILILVFYIAGNSIVHLLGNDSDYIKHALEYLYFVIPAGIPMFTGAVFMGILQGEGHMKKVMVSMIIGTGLNIVLDPVFIFILGMNVQGAAIATVLSQVLATLYLLQVFYKNQSAVHISWKLNNIRLNIIREIVVICLPQTSSQIMLGISFIVFNTIIIKLNPYAFTAYIVAGQLEQPLLFPIISIGAALVTMVGQNYGRGNYERIKEIWATAIRISLITAAVIAIAFMVLAPQIYPFFSKVPEVISWAVKQTRVIYLSLVFSAITILAASYYQALAKPVPSFVIPLLRLLVLAMPMLLLYLFVLKLNVLGVWLSAVTANVVTGIISFFLVRSSLEVLVKERKNSLGI